jgi:hypothetical protein
LEITRFVKTIRGKPGRLSITIPTSLTEQYILDPGLYVKVTLQDSLKDPKIFVKFSKPIAKCGERGRLIYIPRKIAVENELKKDTKVLVILETI